MLYFIHVVQHICRLFIDSLASRVMDRLVKLISNASTTRASDDDDFADRLSSRYTVVLLVTFAVLVGMNQYVRNPITCWSPNHFTGAHVRYTSRYCWVKNTYYLPWSSELPPPIDDGVPGSLSVLTRGDPARYSPRQMVTYYQWVPFILLMQVRFYYYYTNLMTFLRRSIFSIWIGKLCSVHCRRWLEMLCANCSSMHMIRRLYDNINLFLCYGFFSIPVCASVEEDVYS